MISIIYSSIGGNTELVALKVSQTLTELNIETDFRHFENVDLAKLAESKLTILAAPTYNQGTLEKTFDSFLKTYAQTFVKNQNFAIIGLGDLKYYAEYLTESVSIMEQIIKENEGSLVLNSLRINGLPVKYLDSMVLKWAQKVAQWYNEN